MALEKKAPRSPGPWRLKTLQWRLLVTLGWMVKMNGEYDGNTLYGEFSSTLRRIVGLKSRHDCCIVCKSTQDWVPLWGERHWLKSRHDAPHKESWPWKGRTRWVTAGPELKKWNNSMWGFFLTVHRTTKSAAFGRVFPSALCTSDPNKFWGLHRGLKVLSKKLLTSL